MDTDSRTCRLSSKKEVDEHRALESKEAFGNNREDQKGKKMSRVPQLTRRQSEARVRQLRRMGCKVWRVRVRGGTVVLKKCPKGLSGGTQFHSEEVRKLLSRSRNLNNRTMIEISRKNCNASIRNFMSARSLLSNARAHLSSIDVAHRPKFLGDRISELSRVLKESQRRVADDCGATFLKRVLPDE